MSTYINTENSNVLNTEDSNRLVTESSVPNPPPPPTAPPAVISISPTTGSTAGGTAVTITGTGFSTTTAVNFGITAAVSYTVNSDTQITAYSPSHVAGTVDVTVTNSYGTSPTSSADLFTYTAPTIPLCDKPESKVSTYIGGNGFNIKLGGTASNIITGYAYATPIYCSINIANNVQPATILNQFSIFVQYGDGTEEEITQVTNSLLLTNTHTYKWPGEYEIKVSVIPKNGCPIATFSQVFSVYNYVTDSMTWDYTKWPELTPQHLSLGALYHGFQSCPPGNLYNPTPLTFNYTVSNLVSSDINFNFYSQNSLSQPWEAISSDNNYSQLRPQWRFTDLYGNKVSSISATTITPVYIKYTFDSNNNLIYTRTTAVDGTLVGYTGTVDFYYIDDIPSLGYTNDYTVQAPVLWVTYNTSDIPNLQDKNDGTSPGYSNSLIFLSAGFYVKNLSADNLNVSLNGGNIELPNIIWPDTDNRFFVTVNGPTLSSADFSNKVLLNYPITTTTGNASVATKVIPAAAATIYTPTFTFSRYDSVGRDTGGYYKNILSTLPLSSALLSSGNLLTTITLSTSNFKTIIEPPPTAGNFYSVDSRKSLAITNQSLTGVALSGSFNFNINNFYKNYFVRKVNENFNLGEQLQSYLTQPFIAENANFVNYLSALGGDNVHPGENYGTVAYERIANFVPNNMDPEVCGVNNLYSLSESIDTEFDNYNFTPPPVLKRQFDLYSVSHEKLWGTREQYDTNFNAVTDHTNLGVTLTAYNTNATVTAGQKIVLNDIIQSTFYELIEVPSINSYASIVANNMQAYFPPASSLTFPLTSYPLSSFFGWGLKTPVLSSYRFYIYNPVTSNIPVDGLIDWNTRTNGLSTTLSETVSSLSAWYADGGILENIYSYYMSKGLNLIGSKYYRQ